MNREQIVEQAKTMLGLLSTLDANEVAQVLGTALVEHIAKCCSNGKQFCETWQIVHEDTDELAHNVFNKNWGKYSETAQ